MTINDKTLENLSKLSKIKIDDNLRDKLKEDLNLTMNMIDEIKPFGYETSDQKELYLSRQDLQARLFVPNADQSLLLPFKRSK